MTSTTETPEAKMSTKCSIAYGDNFHLYQDLLDEGHVCLRLSQCEFEARPDELVVKIPLPVWEFLRSFPGTDLSGAGKNDEEIHQEAIAQVDERLDKYRAADGGPGKNLLQLSGALVMGAIDLPREQQIANTVRHRQELRDRQRKILAEIEALRTIMYSERKLPES